MRPNPNGENGTASSSSSTSCYVPAESSQTGTQQPSPPEKRVDGSVETGHLQRGKEAEASSVEPLGQGTNWGG